MRITCLNYTPFATTWPCLCTCGTVQNQSRAHARNLWAAPGWIHKTSDRTHLSECSTITYFAGTVIIINQGVRCKHDWVLYYLFPWFPTSTTVCLMTLSSLIRESEPCRSGNIERSYLCFICRESMLCLLPHLVLLVLGDSLHPIARLLPTFGADFRCLA